MTPSVELMDTHTLLRQLRGGSAAPGHLKCFALVDCAAARDFDDDDALYERLHSADVVCHSLLTGEPSWRARRSAPCLVPLNDQPELLQWLLEEGRGRGWAVYLAADAPPDTAKVLHHLRRFYRIRAANGRRTYFRFFDPTILVPFLENLNPAEGRAFFGPVRRFVVEAPGGRPRVFERPILGDHARAGDTVTEPDDPVPPVLITSRRHIFATAWNRRLMADHAARYQAMGVAVAADPENNRLTLQEKDGSRATLQKTAAGVNVSTGEGRTFRYELSTCKNPTAVIDPAGHRIDLDLQERENVVTLHKAGLLHAIRMEDNRKQWVFEYDTGDHPTRIDYPDGTCARMQHDTYGHLASYTDRNGHTTRFDRDHQERLTRMQDANGHETRFEHEDRTAPAHIRFPDGMHLAFTYDDAGRLQTLGANDRKVADYRYAPRIGEWEIQYADGGSAQFTEAQGRIVRAANDAGSVEMTYDPAGQLLQERFNNRTVTYQRNEAGLLTGLTTPDGRTITYGRDGEQRVAAITDWTCGTIAIQYAASGALAAIAYPNGARFRQKCDPSGLPRRMTLKNSAAEDLLFDRQIERDLLGRVRRMATEEVTIAYDYDPEGHLTGVHSERSDLCETFTLDAKANRLADRHGPCAINAADRIAAPGHTYDPLGNLTRKPGHVYRWQSANRLVEAADSRTKVRAAYRYDAFGRRVAKTVGDVRTHYVWAGHQLLQEIVMGPDGDRTIDYLYFPGTAALLAINDNGRIRYAHFGQRYETLCLTDKAGAVVWQAEYNAFGTARIRQGAEQHQPMRLAGHYHDAETGLHYVGARYYDPQQGRYLSLDPLFLEGGGENFYAYCNHDPVNHIDPTGELIFAPILIGAAIGAAIGAGVAYYRQKQAGKGVDGFGIAKAALLGGAIGAVGGAAGMAMNAATAGSALAKTTFGAMAANGFLSGAAGSVAEQCAASALTDAATPPLAIATEALSDGILGAGIGLITFGSGGVMARRAGKAQKAIIAADSKPRPNTVKQRAQQEAAVKSKKAETAAAKNTDHTDKSSVGEPVNAVSGEVILSQTDFALPGPIPLAWTRHYGSQQAHEGLLGRGWQTPADARLELQDDLVLFYDGSPGAAVFETLPVDKPVMEASNGALLSKTADGYSVTQKSGLRYHFAEPFAAGQTPVSRISDPSGNTIRFVRSDNILTRIEDSAGRTLQITCEKGRIVAITCNRRPLVRYHFNRDQLTAAQDPSGHSRRYAYDDHQRLVRHSDRNHLSFYYEYDARGRCTRTHGDGGLYDTRLHYEPYQRLTRVTDAQGHAREYHYDANRLPTKVVDPTGAATCYAYDEVGRILRVTDPLERTTEYDYDPAGNLLAIHRPDNSAIAIVYDPNHRPVQTLDPDGGLWQQRFDEKGRLIEAVTPLGHSTVYRYNHRGLPSSVTDANGHSTTFEWDNAGQIATIVSPTGRRTHYQHDPWGNPTAVIDPAGGETRYSYDDNNRPVTTISPGELSQHFAWDPEGNLLLHTDAAGHQTRFEYTGLNEPARRIHPDGTSVRYTYDSQERLTAVTNERGEQYRFAYDPAGHLVSRTDYYGHSHNFRYDAAGQLIESIDPLKRTIDYSYDPLGRLVQKRFADDQYETFTRDRAGRLTAFESPDIRIERRYDADGNLIVEQSPGCTVQYQYDPTGQRIQRTSTLGNTIGYAYDADGLATAITINASPVRIERNALGQITTEKAGAHLTRRYRYDQHNRLIHQHITTAQGPIERRFEYDLAGNLTTRSDNHKGNHHFSYDPMGRLIAAGDPRANVQQHIYDPTGDLLQHLQGPQIHLRSATHNNHTYRFDAAGNLTERQQNRALTRFEYDENNRLRTVHTPEETTVRMAYDALGRRRTKTVNGTRTTFYWDGDTLLAEHPEDHPIREYIYHPGTFEPLAAVDATGAIFYYHNDINGLPCELTRPNGQIVWSAVYDALGRVESLPANETSQPLRLQGQYRDEETGLCYNRHRYFDPEICSFITQDPIGLAGGENLYAYAPNVWGWVDPLGLFGFGGPGAKYKGHADFSGYDVNFFDFNLEDEDWRTSPWPWGKPKNHFMPLNASERDAKAAIEAGDNIEFARAMHRGQDYFSHYSKGYRWKPFRAWKSLGFGHGFAGTKPDQDINAWNKAEEWTKKWLSKWHEKWSKPNKC